MLKDVISRPVDYLLGATVLCNISFFVYFFPRHSLLCGSQIDETWAALISDAKARDAFLETPRPYRAFLASFERAGNNKAAADDCAGGKASDRDPDPDRAGPRHRRRHGDWRASKKDDFRAEPLPRDRVTDYNNISDRAPRVGDAQRGGDRQQGDVEVRT